MVTEYVIYSNVDYLSLTEMGREALAYFDSMPVAEERGKMGYDICHVSELGVRCFVSKSNSESMGRHYVYSGQALANIRNSGLSDLELIETMLALPSLKIRRIDLALTSHPASISVAHGATPNELSKLNAVSRMRRSNEIAFERKTETLYYGSLKNRKRLFRAYDKGIESGFVSDWLVRYELQTNENSERIARALVGGASISGIIKKFVDYPTSPDYQAIVGATAAALPYIKPDEKNRWQWLVETAALAVGNALTADYEEYGILAEDNEEFREFIAACMRAYRRKSLVS